MRTVIITLMLIFSITTFSNDSFMSKTKLWLGAGAGVGFGTNNASNVNNVYGSLNFTYDKFQVKTRIITPFELYPEVLYPGALFGYELFSTKNITLSGLGGISIGIANKGFLTAQEYVVSIPLELEFIAHLKYIGVGGSLYAELNNEYLTVGIMFKLSFGKLY